MSVSNLYLLFQVSWTDQVQFSREYTLFLIMPGWNHNSEYCPMARLLLHSKPKWPARTGWTFAAASRSTMETAGLHLISIRTWSRFWRIWGRHERLQCPMWWFSWRRFWHGDWTIKQGEDFWPSEERLSPGPEASVTCEHTAGYRLLCWEAVMILPVPTACPLVSWPTIPGLPPVDTGFPSFKMQ
jgi:hypothetical protein